MHFLDKKKAVAALASSKKSSNKSKRGGAETAAVSPQVADLDTNTDDAGTAPAPVSDKSNTLASIIEDVVRQRSQSMMLDFNTIHDSRATSVGLVYNPSDALCTHNSTMSERGSAHTHKSSLESQRYSTDEAYLEAAEGVTMTPLSGKGKIVEC